MKKQEIGNIVVIIIIVILILIGTIMNINIKIKESYTKGSYDGYNHVADWLTIAYSEKGYPTNCSMEKFPYYLTTNELSMSELDNNKTFWIMLVSRTQWDCVPREDYGMYGNKSNWCDCRFTG